jgi:hypothetical protein
MGVQVLFFAKLSTGIPQENQKKGKKKRWLNELKPATRQA